jgi:hypothetical protein
MPCPPLLFSNEALMRAAGFNAHPVRDGVCQRGVAKRQARARKGLFVRRPWPTIL